MPLAVEKVRGHVEEYCYLLSSKRLCPVDKTDNKHMNKRTKTTWEKGGCAEAEESAAFRDDELRS